MGFVPRLSGKQSGPPPIYGTAIDEKVITDVRRRRVVGLAVDDAALYNIVKAQLISAGMTHLLVEFGGKYSFGHGWCQRFCARWNLVTRTATTKMRVLPLNFDRVLEEYIVIAALQIAKGDIPPCLVVNCDETKVNFVNRATRTKSEIGEHKVRVIGMASDKAAMTCTLAISELGDVLPHQLIFAGTTKRCHPSHAMSEDSIWCHTKSHWQSVATYMQYIEDIIVPFKTSMITKWSLPFDQKMLLKHDQIGRAHV